MSIIDLARTHWRVCVQVRIGRVVFHIPYNGENYLMFRCRKCGWCCRNMKWGALLLTVGDVKRLSSRLGYGSISEFLDRECIYSTLYEREVYTFEGEPLSVTYRGWFLKRYDGETAETIVQPHSCRFQQENLCSIYEDRPMVCRKYPYAINWDCYAYLHACYAYTPQSRCRGFVKRKNLKRKWLSPWVKTLLEVAEEIEETTALGITIIEEVAGGK